MTEPLAAVHPGIPAVAVVLLVAVRLRPRPAARGIGAPPTSLDSATHQALQHQQLPARGARQERPGRHDLLAMFRRRATDASDVADWCDRIAREIRSGATLAAAAQRAEPRPALAATVAPMRLALQRGESLTSAVGTIDTDQAEIRLVLTALATLARHGGPAAEPIDRAAMTLRARAAIEAERRTQSAQARLSALVMTLLPAAMLMLLVATSASVRGALTQPIGLVVITLGAALNLVGWRWMRRIVNSGAT